MEEGVYKHNRAKLMDKGDTTAWPHPLCGWDQGPVSTAPGKMHACVQVGRDACEGVATAWAARDLTRTSPWDKTLPGVQVPIAAGWVCWGYNVQD